MDFDVSTIISVDDCNGKSRFYAMVMVLQMPFQMRGFNILTQKLFDASKFISAKHDITTGHFDIILFNTIQNYCSAATMTN